MEQLELTATLKKTNDPKFPYEMTVRVDSGSDYHSWYRGETAQEVMDMFYKSFSNKQLKYWYMLVDK